MSSSSELTSALAQQALPLANLAHYAAANFAPRIPVGDRHAYAAMLAYATLCISRHAAWIGKNARGPETKSLMRADVDAAREQLGLPVRLDLRGGVRVTSEYTEAARAAAKQKAASPSAAVAVDDDEMDVNSD